MNIIKFDKAIYYLDVNKLLEFKHILNNIDLCRIEHLLIF